MRRNRLHRRPRLSPESEQLIRLAQGLANSGSRAEDSFWEERLGGRIVRLLEESDDEALNAAFDELWTSDGRAYDELADMVEASCEGDHIEVGTKTWDVLLIAAPVLAWSRFQVASGPIPKDVLDTLRVQMQAHVLAGGARLALANFLYSPDQLPTGYSQTRSYARTLWNAAIGESNLRQDQEGLPQTQPFISDTRYLLGAVAAPRGHALFRWQEKEGAECTREHALKAWRAQGGPCFAPLLPACAFELLIPDAYHASWRNADLEGRPFSVRAAVAYLEVTLGRPAAHFRAVMAGFHGKQLEEYRIGLTTLDSPDVVHGVVWPLLGAEDDNSDLPEQIDAALRAAGVENVIALDQRFPLEYCDDCGAPVFPNPQGEPVHAELPEEVAEQPTHLH